MANKVWQINLHHSKLASDNLASEVAKMAKPPIILIQEPYLYKDKVKLNLINYNLFHKPKSRSLIAIPCAIKSFFLNSISDRDTVSVLLTEGNNSIILASVYLDILDDKVISCGLEYISKYSSDSSIPMILGLDSNAHSTLWGCEEDNKRGETLEEWILLHNLAIKNKGKVPTFVTTRAETIIDITLVSDIIANKITNWNVNKEYQFSDHRRIEYTLEFSTKNVVYTRNFRTTNWEHFRDILKGKSKWVPPLRWTKYTLDQEATKFLEIIKETLDKACPVRQIDFGNKRKSWWNNNLAALKAKTKRLFRKFKLQNSQTNYDNFHEARKSYYKEISKAKKESWIDFCSSILDVKSFSKVSKSLTSGDKVSMGQLRKDDGSVTLDETDTLNTLMDCHFPGSIAVAGTMESSADDIGYSHKFIMEAPYLGYITMNKVKQVGIPT